jgi:hypothetical protein
MVKLRRLEYGIYDKARAPRVFTITFIQSIITVFKGGSNSTRAPIQLAGIAKRVTTGTKMTQSATDIVILGGQVQLYCASYHVGTF